MQTNSIKAKLLIIFHSTCNCRTKTITVVKLGKGNMLMGRNKFLILCDNFFSLHSLTCVTFLHGVQILLLLVLVLCFYLPDSKVVNPLYLHKKDVFFFIKKVLVAEILWKVQITCQLMTLLRKHGIKGYNSV